MVLEEARPRFDGMKQSHMDETARLSRIKFETNIFIWN